MSVLQCNSLSKHYGKIPALEQVSFAIEPGRIVGLLGPNGSGKTTLIKTAAGLLTPSAGELRINGQRPGVASKLAVSYLPERTYLNDWMKVADILAMFRDFYSNFDTAKAAEMLARLSINPGDRLKTMSKGTKEKVQLVLVMARTAKLYLLDEPIAGVDPAARDFILRTILTNYNEEGTVLISTHLISDVEKVLDEAIFLKQGKIMLHQTVDAIRAKENKSVDALFREIFQAGPMFDEEEGF